MRSIKYAIYINILQSFPPRLDGFTMFHCHDILVSWIFLSSIGIKISHRWDIKRDDFLRYRFVRPGVVQKCIFLIIFWCKKWWSFGSRDRQLNPHWCNSIDLPLWWLKLHWNHAWSQHTSYGSYGSWKMKICIILRINRDHSATYPPFPEFFWRSYMVSHVSAQVFPWSSLCWLPCWPLPQRWWPLFCRTTTEPQHGENDWLMLVNYVSYKVCIWIYNYISYHITTKHHKKTIYIYIYTHMK